LPDVRLDHAHHVGRARVLVLDRLRQRVVQRLLECHGTSSARLMGPRLARFSQARLGRRGPSPATSCGSHDYCTRNRGSSTSRRPSPRRFSLSPEAVSTRPGKGLSQSATRITILALASTVPHDGTAGGTPN